jgi:hypothetical protein
MFVIHRYNTTTSSSSSSKQGLGKTACSDFNTIEEINCEAKTDHLLA